MTTALLSDGIVMISEAGTVETHEAGTTTGDVQSSGTTTVSGTQIETETVLTEATNGVTHDGGYGTEKLT